MKSLKILGVMLLGMLIIDQISEAGIRNSKHDLLSSGTDSTAISDLNEV